MNWKYFKKLHPTLPVIQVISEHVEAEFKTWTRYKAHTSPNDNKGVALLQRAYKTSDVHATCVGRKVVDSEKVSDFYNDGLITLGRPMARWATGRQFDRSRDEDWTSLAGEDYDSRNAPKRPLEDCDRTGIIGTLKKTSGDVCRGPSRNGACNRPMA